MKRLLLILLLALPAFACEDLTDGSRITSSIDLCSDTFDVPNGITISGENIAVDCGTAVLRGVQGESEIGVRIEHAKNVTLRRCNILTFNQGLYLKNVSFSHVHDNAFLKNRIGIRMLDSFENVFEKNADKSHQLAVSAINSKFNIVMLDNKNIERDFCLENSCNRFIEMNPCQTGDFYCSPRCDKQLDGDCGSLVIEETSFEAEVPDAPVMPVRSLPAPTGNFIVPAVNETIEPESPARNLSLVMKTGIYLSLYLVALLGLWVVKR